MPSEAFRLAQQRTQTAAWASTERAASQNRTEPLDLEAVFEHPESVFSLGKNAGTRAPWTRGVLGMFVVVCLNLALQPCAMAMGGDQDHGCPHCPPPESQAHHGHHGSTAEAVDQTHCATVGDDCSLGDDLNYDGRNAQVKLKDLPIDTPLAIGDLFATATAARFVDVGGVYPTRSPPPASSPPLNVLYCVYLD